MVRYENKYQVNKIKKKINKGYHIFMIVYSFSEEKIGEK